MFPQDPMEFIETTRTEGELIQSLNSDVVEIAGLQGISKRLISTSEAASTDSSLHASQEVRFAEETTRHIVGAENASDRAVFHAQSSAAERKETESMQHGLLSGVAAFIALESRAKANSLAEISKVEQAKIEEEMRFHQVVEEETRRSAAATAQDLESEAAAASIDKDSAFPISPLKMT